MTSPFRSLLMAVAVLATIHAPTTAQEYAPLTKVQVEGYINSSIEMLRLINKYSGDRQFTPHGIIMPHRGTIERAMVEMKAEGTFPKFTDLLRKHGFDSYKAWKQLRYRITNALFLLKADDTRKPKYPLSPEELKSLLRQRDQLQKVVSESPDKKSRANLQSINLTLGQHRRWELANEDSRVVAPFQTQLQELILKGQRAVQNAQYRKPNSAN